MTPGSWLVVMSAGVLFGTVAWLVLRADRDYARQDREAPTQVFWVGWARQLPDHPLTVPEAHRLMQDHRLCMVDECPCKSAAWRTLVPSRSNIS